MFEIKTRTPNVPFLTSTQVYHLILFIYASKFMSLQIKKPLSAQAVGTDMYKNGGVSHSHPATKQPEWSTKSRLYRETDEKKKLLPTSKMSSPTDCLDLKLQLISDIVKAEWLQVWGAKTEPSVGERSVAALTWLTFGRWIYKMSACVRVQSGASDKKDAGLTQVRKQIHLYKGAWVKHGDKWRASCSCPPLELHFHHSETSRSFGSY